MEGTLAHRLSALGTRSSTKTKKVAGARQDPRSPGKTDLGTPLPLLFHWVTRAVPLAANQYNSNDSGIHALLQICSDLNIVCFLARQDEAGGGKDLSLV